MVLRNDLLIPAPAVRRRGRRLLVVIMGTLLAALVIIGATWAFLNSAELYSYNSRALSLASRTRLRAIRDAAVDAGDPRQAELADELQLLIVEMRPPTPGAFTPQPTLRLPGRLGKHK